MICVLIATDQEWEDLPHIHLMHEDDWDPSVLDHKQSGDQEWYDKHHSMPLLFLMFDKQDNIHQNIEAHASQLAQLHGEPIFAFLHFLLHCDIFGGHRYW